MPRFAATALGWTGGWARHPTQAHLGKATGCWAGRVAWEQVPQRVTRTWGRPRWLSRLRTAPTNRAPRGSAGLPVSSALGQPSFLQEPNSASSLEPHQLPGTSPATWSRGHRSGLRHPPPGWESSLVLTVVQKAAHPWAGSPQPCQPMSQRPSTSA